MLLTDESKKSRLQITNWIPLAWAEISEGSIKGTGVLFDLIL